MHCVDQLEQALQIAMNSGFQVRQEWLNEKGGGACRIGDQKVLFVDLSLTAEEQLEQVVAALRTLDNLCLSNLQSSPLLKRLV